MDACWTTVFDREKFIHGCCTTPCQRGAPITEEEFVTAVGEVKWIFLGM